jgi:hypothetical protein
MNNPRTFATEWVLIESAAKSESEEDFLILSGGSASDPEVRAISGAAALLETLRRLAPRRVILDFQISFRRGLNLLRTLKSAAPELKLLARVRSLGSLCAEPLYFSVEVGTLRVSFHRVSPDGVRVTPKGSPTVPAIKARVQGGTCHEKASESKCE